MEIVRRKIGQVMPDLSVVMVPQSTRGDQLRDVPLHTVEGTDFFTREIIDTLERGEADMAIHSLKDMSSAHFFGDHQFAVVNRELPHDMLLLRQGWMEKLSRGEILIIGTCSPRREEMALDFLKKALPQGEFPVHIQSKPIRGNVETRLRKLHQGDYDGTILALAGLSRLWLDIKEEFREFGFTSLVLPLLDCVPAPCQGSIVAEALPGHSLAKKLFAAINDPQAWEDSVREKMTGLRYGQGCLQKFGVTTLHYDGQHTTFAAGVDELGNSFSRFDHLPDPRWEGKRIFSTTDHMRDFFAYEFIQPPQAIQEPVVYIANYKSLAHPQYRERWKALLNGKRVWAAGSKTWFELSAMGILVEGCADALGLESLLPIWEKPLIGIRQPEVLVLTHEQATGIWQGKGWKTRATHRLLPKYNSFLAREIAGAEVIFWTSAGQYELYKNVIGLKVIHACPFGETAIQLKSAGLAPVVFPTIKSFLQWRKSMHPSVSVA